MRIGIDIDGVIVDIEKWQLEYGSKFLYENSLPFKIDNKAYFTDKAFGITQELDDKLWGMGIHEYVKEPPRAFAREVIQKLKDDGNEIYIITARNGNIKYAENMNQPIMEEIVREWFKKYHIYYDKLIFTPENKVPTCLENKIDIMIDDSPRNIEDISKHVPVICFNAGYNENKEFNNTTRCYTWYDVLSTIEKLNKKDRVN